MKLFVALICIFVVAAVGNASGPGTCYTCLSDAGSGDDLALCNAQQWPVNCSTQNDMVVGTTHCFTLAGRYERYNGSQVISLDGVARGCINCSNTETACQDGIKRFNSLQNWTLKDCNIKCCTGTNCNTQNITLLPLTSSTAASDTTTSADTTSPVSSTTGRHVLSGMLALVASISGACLF